MFWAKVGTIWSLVMRIFCLGNLLFLFIIFDGVVEMDFDYFIRCVELFDLSYSAKFEVL